MGIGIINKLNRETKLPSIRKPNPILKHNGLKNVSKVNEFPFYQPLFEKGLIFCEKLVKRSKLSNNPEVLKIEKTLLEMGVSVRFKNNLDIANFIQKGFNDVKSKGYNLPKNILIVNPHFIFGAGGAAAIFREGLKAEAPILLPKTIKAMSQEKIVMKNKLGIYSTDNISYYIHHEVGHWLHFQNKPSQQVCEQIWKKANQELIGKEVSQMALKLTDGTEFVAEVFAGLIDGHQYNNYVMEIYKELKGPTTNITILS